MIGWLLDKLFPPAEYSFRLVEGAGHYRGEYRAQVQTRFGRWRDVGPNKWHYGSKDYATEACRNWVDTKHGVGDSFISIPNPRYLPKLPFDKGDVL